jgi:hypothetical protein
MPKGWQRGEGRSNARRARKVRHAEGELYLGAIVRISKVPECLKLPGKIYLVPKGLTTM